MSESSSSSSFSSSSSSKEERSDTAVTSTDLGASVAVEIPASTKQTINASVTITTTDEQKKETVQEPVGHVEGENPLVKCRCGCVPKDMMSLFQMAELRARFREEKKRKEAEAAAQNLPQGRM